MLNLNYNEQHDVLYLGIGDNSNSYCADESGNVNIFKDLYTDDITGYVIFDFKRRYFANKLPEILSPFVISYENDVLPMIRSLCK